MEKQRLEILSFSTLLLKESLLIYGELHSVNIRDVRFIDKYEQQQRYLLHSGPVLHRIIHWLECFHFSFFEVLRKLST